MPDLVRNLNCWFSHANAQMEYMVRGNSWKLGSTYVLVQTCMNVASQGLATNVFAANANRVASQETKMYQNLHSSTRSKKFI